MRNKELVLITGGRQVKEVKDRDHLRDCYRAIAMIFDFATERIVAEYSESCPGDGLCSEGYSYSFRGVFSSGNRVLVPTPSEIVEFSIPGLRVENRISDRVLNDVHHSCLHEGRLLVVSTGLDIVLSLRREGRGEDRLLIPVRDGVSVEEDKDYRGVSTKPHVSHPNYLFELRNSLYVTRFNEKDAVRLSDREEILSVEPDRPHDGHVVGDRVAFTSVNGCVSIFRSWPPQLERVVDLSREMPRREMGWCRGLEFDGDDIYVGFSVLRRTRLMRNLAFVGGKIPLRQTSKIVKYSLLEDRILKVVSFDPGVLSLVFSIHRLDG